MKVKFKNVAFAIATVALAGVIAHQAYAKQQEQAMSDVMLSNVEALSDDETSGRDDCITGDGECSMLIIYPDGDWGEEIIFGMVKAPGWI